MTIAVKVYLGTGVFTLAMHAYFCISCACAISVSVLLIFHYLMKVQK